MPSFLILKIGLVFSLWSSIVLGEDNLDCDVEFQLLDTSNSPIEKLIADVDAVVAEWDKKNSEEDLILVDKDNPNYDYYITKKGEKLSLEEYKILFEKSVKDVEKIYFALIDYVQRNTVVVKTKDKDGNDVYVARPDAVYQKANEVIAKVQQIRELGAYAGGVLWKYFKDKSEEAKKNGDNKAVKDLMKKSDDYGVAFTALNIRAEELAYEISSIKTTSVDKKILEDNPEYRITKDKLLQKDPIDYSDDEVKWLKRMISLGSHFFKGEYALHLKDKGEDEVARQIFCDALELGHLGSRTFYRNEVPFGDQKTIWKWYARGIKYGEKNSPEVKKNVYENDKHNNFSKKAKIIFKAYQSLPEFKFDQIKTKE
jgi:hypothetical protein